MKYLSMLMLGISFSVFAIGPNTIIHGQADKMSRGFYADSIHHFEQQFPAKFTVSTSGVQNHVLSSQYSCPEYGKNISPPIEWQGIPAGTQRLHLTFEDATCTLGCDNRGKFDHWVLDFPVKLFDAKQQVVSHTGLTRNAAVSPILQPYTKKNGLQLKKYIGPCPPNKQAHAFVIKLIAYKYNKVHKKIIIGKTQSAPFIFPG